MAGYTFRHISAVEFSTGSESRMRAAVAADDKFLSVAPRGQRARARESEILSAKLLYYGQVSTFAAFFALVFYNRCESRNLPII